ncbi:protein of unknown function [Microbacterium sp. Nx66]|nr:protein of unknown function [Microbacterium sp. Nx66]
MRGRSQRMCTTPRTDPQWRSGRRASNRRERSHEKGRHLTGGMRCRPRRLSIGGIGRARAGMRFRLSSSVRKATVLTKPIRVPTFGSIRRSGAGIDSP